MVSGLTDEAIALSKRAPRLSAKVPRDIQAVGNHHLMKPKLTFEQHVDMGRALESVRNELQRRHVQLANAYPRSGPEGGPAKKLEAAFKAVNEARSELDSALFREHPDEAETTVYYPKR